MQLNSRIVGACSALLLVPVALITPQQPLLGLTSGSDGSPGRFVCTEAVLDRATGGCLKASSEPGPGLLFPPPHDGGLRNTTAGNLAFIGGGAWNAASGAYATIGGGFQNRADRDATVGGGTGNEAGTNATVAGGDRNRALGAWAAAGGGYTNEASGLFATVAGGWRGSATEELSTISGGYRNTTSGVGSAIGGGKFNEATALAATVPGGFLNTAAGAQSFAAGRKAKALHNGAFVWGDSFDEDKSSSAADQFNVYASGGTRIFSNSAATTGVLLAAGGGSWTSVSDRDAKENITPVDPQGVLERLSEIPIATWNYKTQDDGIRHMGPMAQDFYAAFGLGLGDKSIDTIDLDGVALAAIQGLHGLVREGQEKLAEKDAEIAQLRAELEDLRRALIPLTSR